MMYDAVIMRTIVDLPLEQVRSLDLWCQREHISRAEGVRRALNSLLSSQQANPRAEAFGAWSGKKLESRHYVETLRSEWGK